MKSSLVIYTPLIKNLQDLNQEIRRRLSSMPSYTEQEMRNLEVWSDEVEKMVKSLDNVSLLIFQHLQLLKIKLKERQEEDTSKD